MHTAASALKVCSVQCARVCSVTACVHSCSKDAGVSRTAIEHSAVRRVNSAVGVHCMSGGVRGLIVCTCVVRRLKVHSVALSCTP